jgi:tripartite-type tricarboxylate transporter receptor subunit TctC
MTYRIISLALVAVVAVSAAHAAEGYPEKPLRFVVPFPPGGGTDGLARILGAKLTEFSNQQVIIDNRAGAQGSVGTAVGAKAPPDGHTITLAHSGSLVINPHLYSNAG